MLGAVVLVVAAHVAAKRHASHAPATDVPDFFTSNAVEFHPARQCRARVSVSGPHEHRTSRSSALFSIGISLQNSLLDQAVAGMRYDLVGGSEWFPSPTGRDGTTAPAVLEPRSVQTLFDVALTGNETRTQRAVLSHGHLANDLRLFLRKYNVQTVLVVNRLVFSADQRSLPVGRPAMVTNLVTAVIGQPISRGGVTVWFHVGQRLAAMGGAAPTPRKA